MNLGYVKNLESHQELQLILPRHVIQQFKAV